MNIELREISFDDILPIWHDHLWPGRTSALEPASAIKYGSYPYDYDMSYMNSPKYFYGVFLEKELIGVNSGHVTGNSFRSRGLWVAPLSRGNGISTILLSATKDTARNLNLEFVWTMPRATSIFSYCSNGFIRSSEWFQTETSDANCFAICNERPN